MTHLPAQDFNRQPAPVSPAGNSLVALFNRLRLGINRRAVSRIGLATACIGLGLTAQAQISGKVFLDYNASGSPDAGEPGKPNVLVTAFLATGAQAGSVATDANGFYSLTPAGAGPFRIEFTNVGAGYFDGVSGSGSGSSVQFVQTATATASLGLYSAADLFCQPNPQVAVPCYVNGDPLKDVGQPGTASVQNALVSVAYTSDGTRPDMIHYAPMSAIGAVWGLAYQKESKKLFSAAFIKRHAGLGPLGPGGIYITDVTTQTTRSFFKLEDFPGISAGPDPHSGLPALTDQPNYDAATYTQVGKAGLGGIDLSEDGTVLYVVNLFDRKLYSFPIGNPAVRPTTFRTFDIPRPDGSDSRPFALKVYQGKVYVGVTGTSESEYGATVKANPQVVSPNLKGYVYAIDPGAAAPVFTNVLEFPFTYIKGASIINNIHTNQWFPWVPAYNKAANDPPFLFESPGAGGMSVRMYPQPWLTDIEITGDGAMVLGIRNREGDQIGQVNYLPDPTGQDTTRIRTHGVGDILKAGKCDPASGRWTLENDASVCGGVATAGKDNGQGPGGGEFYYQDNSADHQETSDGSLLYLPGSNEIMTTATDPLGIYSGGLYRYNNTTGQGVAAVQVYQSNGKDPSLFGKSAGLGDIELLPDCGNAPLEIGNRIWVDQNGDGVQGADEPGVDGLAVALYQGDLKVGAAVTNLFGEYYFNPATVPDGLMANTAYQIRVESKQSGLAGFALTQANAGGNKLLDSDGLAVGTTWIINVTTGNKGETNHSYDMGLRCAITAVASATAALCGDGTIRLSATGGSTYRWTGPTGFTAATANPVITNANPAALGKYTVTVATSYPFGTNATLNPDFRAGNAGFASEYTYTGGNPFTSPGQYTVVELPYTAPGTHLDDPNALPAGLTDHTSGTAAGYVQLVSGSAVAYQRVWYQTVPVKPNTSYRFSFAAANATQPADAVKPHISALVNGVVVIPDEPLATLFQWKQFDYTWESGANTTATFAIADPVVSSSGNRFALDDIAILAVGTCTASASTVVTSPSAGQCAPVTIHKIKLPTLN